ncbi:hypothetical protein DFJ74DRAFT_707662 [Hyaloraphidium curvatum]|nr:hypothetical protein DFJ74DRAFT_707662 [Hyaloraphidium curvatum]
MLPPARILLAIAASAFVALAALHRGGAGAAVECSGTARETARCVFRDAVVSNGTLHYLHLGNSKPPDLPPLLCSVANQPPELAVDCVVRAVRDPTEWAALTAGAQHAKFGVLMARLNPTNLYHILFEEVVPALAVAWDADPAAGSTEDLAVFAADAFGPGHLDEKVFKGLLPRVKLVHRKGPPVRVGRLVVGTRASCAHWGHCTFANGSSRTFEPLDAAVLVRRTVFAALGLPEPPPASSPRIHPRITIVQRSRTRGFAPHALASMNATLARIGGRPPTIVDFASLDLPAQVRLAAQTDMYVLVHGAALGHAMFLPPGSVLMDVYPHAFFVEHNILVPFMLASLAPGVRIGHFPFQIRGTAGQSNLLGPLRPNCTCKDYMCEVKSFWAADRLAPDPAAFARRAAEAADAWRRADYPRPRTQEEHGRYLGDLHAQGGGWIGGEPQCWTDADEEEKRARGLG